MRVTCVPVGVDSATVESEVCGLLLVLVAPAAPAASLPLVLDQRTGDLQ